MNVRARDRLVAAVLLAASGALLLIRLWLLQGWLSVVQIDGGSMAESLLGRHVLLTCANCSRQWNVDHAQWKLQPPLICPECGTRANEQTPASEQPAQRVMIDRAAYLLSAPQRFEIIAFRNDEPPVTWPGELAVKRIVALPGESWEIRQGELYVQGNLVRKSFSEFRELATVVSNSAAAWHAAEHSVWQRSDDAWSCHGSGTEVRWLSYEHVALLRGEMGTGPVQDFDGYNPAVARDLNDLEDVIASCDIDAHDVTITCRVHDGAGPIELRWELAAGIVVARRGEREFARCEPPRRNRTGGRICWGVCDRQLFFVLNHQVLLRHELPQTANGVELPSTPLAIGVSGDGECHLRSVQVHRDVYYLDAHGRGGSWKSHHLGGQQFGVLGDNPPVSIDSRVWDGVEREAILGRVVHYRQDPPY